MFVLPIVLRVIFSCAVVGAMIIVPCAIILRFDPYNKGENKNA